MTTEQHTPADDQWTECPAGEVGGLVLRLQSQRQRATRRETLRQAATGISGLAILIVAGIYAVPHIIPNVGAPAEPNYGGITCTELQGVAHEFVAGRLDQETVAQIDAHLTECGYCRELIANLRKQAASPIETVEHRHAREQLAEALLLASGGR